MLVKPNWDSFKSKFPDDSEESFEWFSYLLFCREFNLEKGWYGFQNQSGIEKSPITVGNEVIGFQSKFYQSRLNDKKSEIIDTIEKTHRDYPTLTKLIFYTNQSWTQNYDKKLDKMVNTKAYNAVYDLASKYKIELDWRDTAFFESEFVALENNDLSRHFFDDRDHKGWKRFGDWSSKPTDLQAEYYVDEDVKIISPNHNSSKALSVTNALNEIRTILARPKTSIRLVGLSGVGKTRFAQALFDNRIGENVLNIKDVWYCDSGNTPQPIPQHFIEQIIEENKTAIIIVDNCGQELHASLTKAIKSSQTISLLTIEYDVKDDLPEDTNVYKINPTSTRLINKVIERHYPEMDYINVNKISEFAGGNYRLALTIASNINNLDNLSVLTDDQLFKRIFYQKGKLNEELERVGQIFSLVFSFNAEDTEETKSEINTLSELAEVTPRTAYRIIGKLYSQDVIQKRGDFRAILPHALANNLAKQAISNLTNKEINQLLLNSSNRFRTSFIKRISYLHNDSKVINIVESWLMPNGYFGLKILNEELADIDLKDISLLTSVCPDILINIIKIRSKNDSNFLNNSNPNLYLLARLIRDLAYFDRNFKEAFLLLFEIVKNEESHKDSSYKDLLTSLFSYYLSQTEATLVTKTKVIESLSKNNENEKNLLDIIDNSFGSNKHNTFLYDSDNGLIQTYSYKPSRVETRFWFDYLLKKLCFLDIKYPEECRKIITNNLKKIIWISGRSDDAIKYLKILHDRSPFILALLEVKKIIQYNIEALQKSPRILNELKQIEAYMEPNDADIDLLIKTYILPTNTFLIRSSLSTSNSVRITLSGFYSYGNLISYIVNNLNNKIIKNNLKELLTSNNHNVRDIGSYSENTYGNIDSFISDLDQIQHTSKPDYNKFFLSGLSKSIIGADWISYKKLIEYMLMKTEFSFVAPQVMSEVSYKIKHFEFIIDKIIEYPQINFICLGFDLGFKKEHKKISNNLFEVILDRLIILGKDSIVLEALLYDNRQNKTVNNKYIMKILEYLPHCITNRNFYEYNYILSSLVNHSDSTRKEVFKIVHDMIANQNYIGTLESNSLGDILEALAHSNTNDFLNMIYNENQLRYIFIAREFESTLIKLDETEVLNWIGEDQQKIKFWFTNSGFCKHIERDNFEWRDILGTLLRSSEEPSINLTKVIENNVRVTTYSGSYAAALSSRLPIFESLKQHLQEANLDNLIQTVEQEQADLETLIKAELQSETERATEQQRFEW